MGMFDYVRSDYEIFGHEANDHDLQSKSFDCILETIYIDPMGRLWKADYSDAYTIEPSHEMPYLREIPTGKNGRVRFMEDYSGVVRLSGSCSSNGGYCSAAVEVKNGKVSAVLTKYC